RPPRASQAPSSSTVPRPRSAVRPRLALDPGLDRDGGRTRERRRGLSSPATRSDYPSLTSSPSRASLPLPLPRGPPPCGCSLVELSKLRNTLRGATRLASAFSKSWRAATSSPAEASSKRFASAPLPTFGYFLRRNSAYL